MEVIKVVPRGYCKGVINAILIAKKTAQENP
ncbi:4-hydroxy-3-methylbut-2-enyl diphosphate reductase, partial [[Clostridium] innocuum]|nr:4-hydroxy-3-methylbut-2-enyl diphosphate reductase [[Clostridium] innocuum]